jgi:hypothetical protein
MLRGPLLTAHGQGPRKLTHPHHRRKGIMLLPLSFVLDRPAVHGRCDQTPVADRAASPPIYSTRMVVLVTTGIQNARGEPG